MSLPPAPAVAPEPVVAKPKKVSCPSCAHANLEDARFCNACGARMDGRLQDISAPAPVEAVTTPALPPAPPPTPPPATLSPASSEVASTQFTVPPPSPASAPAAPVSPLPVEPAKDPAFDPFAHLDPLLTYPTEPEPPREAPRRSLQPGKMGQLAAFEEPSPEPLPSSSAPALAPDPVAAGVPIWKRPSVLAAFASAAVVAGALGYFLLNKSVPVEPVAELTPGESSMPEESAPIVSAETSQPTSPAPYAMPSSSPSPTSMPSTPRTRNGPANPGLRPSPNPHPSRNAATR